MPNPDDVRPTCPRCRRRSTRDCTFGRCNPEASTVKDTQPLVFPTERGK